MTEGAAWQVNRHVGLRILRVVQFLAVILTALALVPVGAHLMALPNKISLAQEQYFISQSIYRGWSISGAVLVGSLAANLALAVLQRGISMAFVMALLGALLMAATLAIFFVWTFPANVATTNWTTEPANWDMLRWQWEWSYAVNAVVTFAALCSVTESVVLGRD